MKNLNKRKGFGFFAKFIFLLLFVGIIIVGKMSYEAWNFLYTPANKNATAFPVEIKPGSSLQSISILLAKEGIISNAEKFQIYTHIIQESGNLQAGTFLLSPAWTPQQILDELIHGDVILHKMTIREGLPWWTVAKLLEEKGFCKEEDFINIIHDKEFLAEFGIPFPNAEGFLYPDTYLLQKPSVITEESARKVASRLINTFWQKTQALWDSPEFNGKRPSPERMKEIVIMASIVERETRIEQERPKVAGVYYNRLKINMILQADPTIIYGLGKKFKGPLLRKHLQDERNPYNTYKRMGLPPGPICSPSLSAIAATLKPAKHDYYYFVAHGIEANHIFSTNLKNHNRAVSQYRKNLRKNKIKTGSQP